LEESFDTGAPASELPGIRAKASIHDFHGRRSNNFGPVPVPVKHKSAGQWQPRPLSDRSRGKHERRVPCVNADTDASWRAKTHTALILGISKASTGQHGLAALWHGWTGKARRVNCEVRDFQTGASRWRSSRGVVQSLSGAPARMGSWEGKGREGKNYELLNEKYGCAFRLESPWVWKRVLPGPGRGGWAVLLGESSEASRLDMT
jgi:hypothetical protein